MHQKIEIASKVMITRQGDKEGIENDFCKSLRATGFNALVTQGSEVRIEGLRSTVGHYHRTFAERYLVVAGTLTVAYRQGLSGLTQKVVLRAGDAIVLPPYTPHKVLNGSRDTIVLVQSSPKESSHDEVVDLALESPDHIYSHSDPTGFSEASFDQGLRRSVSDDTWSDFIH